MRTLAVVLAAGAGRRVGRAKALLPLGGTTFLGRVVETLRRPGITAVLVVLGHEHERVRPLVPAGALTVLNPDPDRGMLSSVLLGLEVARERGVDALLLHPVDHPLVAPETVDRVLAALAGGAVIAVPSMGGRRGHPGGFARGSWDALAAAPPGAGARAVLGAHPEWVTHVEGDPGCVAGIDTPADYARWVGPPPD